MPEASKRDRIVEYADTLFYEGGFETTSFGDIASALGISRGNFYHHFRTKNDLLDAVIRRRIRATRELLEGWETQTTHPRGRITLFIRILVANRTKIMDFGCPVGTLCSELAKLDHVAQPHAAEIFGLFRDWLADQFRALGCGQASGRLALHLLARSQGIAVMASALRDESFIYDEVAELERWLDKLPNIDNKGGMACS